jgi:hypothetical protein
MPFTLDDLLKLHPHEVVSLINRYRDALTWALGAGGSFPTRPVGKGAYWWRSELQKRAGLKWDGEKFIPE